MPKALSRDQVEQYQRDGFVCPVPVISPDEAADYRARLEAFEATQGGKLGPSHRSKAHLLFKWLDDLMRDKRMLDPVEDLIGRDILCWNTVFWIKEPGSGSYVGWHQDKRYWGIAGAEMVSCWLALSPAPVEAGCMRVMPGSHVNDVLPHRELYHEDNLLTRGQEIADGIDEDEAVFMPLDTGQMSIHSVGTAHGSGPNQTSDRRIGVSLHYVAPEARQTVGDWDTAALVRGTDRFGHFTHTPIPEIDMDPAVAEFHARAAQATSDIVYHGAERQTGKLAAQAYS